MKWQRKLIKTVGFLFEMREPAGILISALEHTSYCPRQCALIHVEQVWDENLFTLRGDHAHKRTDEPMVRHERGKTILRALPVWSDIHGLTGVCDTVEADQPIRIPMPSGSLRPVEYKSGKRTPHIHARIQAGAQALCLEEMFETQVEEIAVYYVASKERVVVPLEAALRSAVQEAISHTKALLGSETLPRQLADKRCRNCSLIDACQPFALGEAQAINRKTLFHPSPEGTWT